jgi:hypothetical protein
VDAREDRDFRAALNGSDDGGESFGKVASKDSGFHSVFLFTVSHFHEEERAE